MDSRTFKGAGLTLEAPRTLKPKTPSHDRSSLDGPTTDSPGPASTVTMRRRVLFRLPPVPARESVELMLFDPDGTLIKRSRHRMMPIGVDATELPPGVYQAEFRWWNGKTNRLERVSVSL